MKPQPMILCPKCRQHAARVVVDTRQEGHGVDQRYSYARVECACGAVGPEVSDFFKPDFKKEAKALFKAG